MLQGIWHAKLQIGKFLRFSAFILLTITANHLLSAISWFLSTMSPITSAKSCSCVQLYSAIAWVIHIFAMSAFSNFSKHKFAHISAIVTEGGKRTRFDDHIYFPCPQQNIFHHFENLKNFKNNFFFFFFSSCIWLKFGTNFEN